jgi:hypothetical protein
MARVLRPPDRPEIIAASHGGLGSPRGSRLSGFAWQRQQRSQPPAASRSLLAPTAGAQPGRWWRLTAEVEDHVATAVGAVPGADYRRMLAAVATGGAAEVGHGECAATLAAISLQRVASIGARRPPNAAGTTVRRKASPRSSRSRTAAPVVRPILRSIAADRHCAPSRRSVLRAIEERIAALPTTLEARPLTGELRLVEDSE